jgi:hypothetical protein
LRLRRDAASIASVGKSTDGRYGFRRNADASVMVTEKDKAQ